MHFGLTCMASPTAKRDQAVARASAQVRRNATCNRRDTRRRRLKDVDQVKFGYSNSTAPCGARRRSKSAGRSVGALRMGGAPPWQAGSWRNHRYSSGRRIRFVVRWLLEDWPDVARGRAGWDRTRSSTHPHSAMKQRVSSTAQPPSRCRRPASGIGGVRVRSSVHRRAWRSIGR